MDQTKGFFVSNSENFELLKELREKIFKLVKKHLNYEHTNSEYGLNYLHELISIGSEAELNEKRVALIQDINASVDCGEIIFMAFEGQIRSIIGNDILVQKNCNLVLQMPNDPNPSELHRDAPGNSCYELVVWVPLVNCYKSKAMYILDFEDTKDAYEKLKNDGNWGKFEQIALDTSQNPEVNFGQALFFSSAVLHGSEINKEKETRVSLNIRFKNIFAPSGFKNQYQFFRSLRVSDFTQIGADLEFDVITAK
ncbi:hypothetical protein N9M53_03980 [Alphaproteobacteria bacterium]|nr:hypothetical protein [Alphaproteobacteria bacterium]